MHGEYSWHILVWKNVHMFMHMYYHCQGICHMPVSEPHQNNLLLLRLFLRLWSPTTRAPSIRPDLPSTLTSKVRATSKLNTTWERTSTIHVFDPDGMTSYVF